MKAILVLATIALAMTTGFTCAKNSPEQAAPGETQAAPSQDQMTAPSAPEAAPPAVESTTTAAPAQ